jgi:hypothetical protein
MKNHNKLGRLAGRWPAVLGLGLFLWGSQAFAQATLKAPQAAEDTTLLQLVVTGQGGAAEKIPAPGKPGAEPAPDGADDDGPSFWSKVPPVFKTPRSGYFFIPPSGPGYYSLRDVIEGNSRDDAPKYPTAPVMLGPVFTPLFDADYRYLEDPDNTQHDFFDPIKRIHVGNHFLISIGGEERLRYMDEVNSRLSGKNNDYLLTRSRVFADLWFQDIFRVYVEFMDSRSTHQNLKPLVIDVDHADFLNLFAELKIWEILDTGIYVRGGRQELCFGSQRLISPLDWANTRRTFQGFRTYWHGENLDLDVFGVQPVIPNVNQFDESDTGQWFTGFWSTYRPQQGQNIDFYYLNLNNIHAVATGAHKVKGGFNTSTFGTRYVGDLNKSLLWDVEGMYQFGDWSNLNTSAGAATAGLGWYFGDLPFTPSVWMYYDFASGDQNPGKDAHSTFNQLFPFGHFYYGMIDDFGRQNIQDLSWQANFRLTKWIYTNFQYHILELDAPKDALYNTAGVVSRVDPTGKSGRDIGSVLHWFTNVHLSQHQDLFLGYAHLFAGSYLQHTAKTPSQGSDGELFYVQYSFRW